MSETKKPLTIEEKLALTKFTTDQNYAHITIKPEICKAECKTYDCVNGCYPHGRHLLETAAGYR